jgi:hydrogenase maturation protease
MSAPILIAGIGNLFNRDDAFGVYTVQRLAAQPVPENVAVRDFGIRGFDLVLALLEGPALTIFVDAVSRGEAPGTLYAIEPRLEDVLEDSAMLENAHGLDPLKVLAMARNLGAHLGRVIVVGCEPATLEDDTGRIGLSAAVEAAVDPAIEMIRSLVHDVSSAGLRSCDPAGEEACRTTERRV